jgi:hypothetical protein
LIHRVFAIGGCGQMVGQEFRLALDEIGKTPLKNSRNASVEFLPPPPQQHGVSSVLHQRVLE